MSEARPVCKYCETPMVEVIGSHLVACPVCGHVLKGPCRCLGCSGGEVPKPKSWLCTLCLKLEPIQIDTEGKRFVHHFCRCFGGAVAPGVGENKRKYVDHQKPGEEDSSIEITVFPEEKSS